MRTLFIALRALIFASGFVLLWGWLALSVRAFDRGMALPSWTAVPGIILMVVGGILALTCVGEFVLRGRGIPAPFDSPRAFVAIGPYRYLRNPMYVGGFTMLVGFSLYEHSISMLLFSLAWLLAVHLFVVLYEEPTLREKFGATYTGYCNAVARWIPKP